MVIFHGIAPFPHRGLHVLPQKHLFVHNAALQMHPAFRHDGGGHHLSGDGGKPVAIGFRAKKSNGKYRYFWLYRVKFGIPSTSLATKGDSITFSTPTIEGTVLRRNKPDGSGKHPWKAEATEGEKNVPDSVITGWYKSVYEPTFTAKLAETGK